MKYKSLLLALILGASALPVFVLAQPSTTPPGGNVDANFDTVTVTASGTDTAVTASSAGVAGQFNGDVNVQGQIENPTNSNNGFLYLNDVVKFDRTAADGCNTVINGSVFGLQNCISGFAFQFGSLIDAYAGIGSRQQGTDTIPLRVLDDSGLSVGNAAGQTGLLIYADGRLRDMDGSPLTIFDTLEIMGTGSELIGHFGSSSNPMLKTSSPSGSFVDLADQSAGINVRGPLSAGPYGQYGIYVDSPGIGARIEGDGIHGLLVDGSPSVDGARIFNRNTPAHVSLANSSGDAVVAVGRVEMAGGTDANGNPDSGLLELYDGMRFDANEIITNTGTTLYLQNDNNGDLRVDGGTLLVDASANIVDVNGHMRANSMGGYLEYTWGYACNSGTTNCYATASYSCPSGTYLVDCGFDVSGSSYVTVYDAYATGNTCLTRGRSNNTTPYTLYAKLKCWDPDA